MMRSGVPATRSASRSEMFAEGSAGTTGGTSNWVTAAPSVPGRTSIGFVECLRTHARIVGGGRVTRLSGAVVGSSSGKGDRFATPGATHGTRELEWGV